MACNVWRPGAGFKPSPAVTDRRGRTGTGREETPTMNRATGLGGIRIPAARPRSGMGDRAVPMPER